MKRLASFVLSFVTAAAAFTLSGADAAPEQREMVAKFWDLMPFEPEDNIGERDAMGPKVVLPAADPTLWGKWKFWNGQWWAKNMLQPDAMGGSWDPPQRGMTKSWEKYNCIWLKASRDVPAEWKGKRLLYEQSDISGCDIVLFVNGKEAGVIRRPEGSVDISDCVTYGGKNEFLMLLTSCGYRVPPVEKATFSGTAKGQSYKAWDSHREYKLTYNPPFFVVTSATCVEDVFANTSWRKHQIEVETTVRLGAAAKAKVIADICDASGKIVKTVQGAYDLPKGVSVVKPSAPWKDPITWELGRGYLYTMKARLVAGGKTYAYPDFKFGFREIWRDERKIYMNGHEQKFRVTYNFGANKFGCKFLQGVGYNCIQYAHQVALDPKPGDELMEYLSKEGISCILPTTGFDWNTKNRIGGNHKEERDDFVAIQSRNLKRFRNWPCVAMCYMGVNAFLPQWTYEAVHLGSGGNAWFDQLMNELAQRAKETNPNILYYSHSDGCNGDVASANLYFNWIPLQECEEWPSRWALRGHFPFQACEFGHPYQYDWYKDDRDLVTEYCASFYGEEAYALEPDSIRIRHKPGLYIRRLQHPLFWRYTDEYVWRITRAWRTFGVNAGIVWFNLDYGYGMPGWKVESIYNKYGPNYGFFKSEEEVPKGRPEWAFPSWDGYRKGNLDFLGWIAGYPRITDRRHAWYPGETVEKQCVMLWDRYDTRAHVAVWKATLGGKKIAGGKFARKLVSNEPAFDKIAFEAPVVKEKTSGKIEVSYHLAGAKGAVGEKIAEDAVTFEIYPKKKTPWEKAPEIALWDPDGKTEPELRKRGIVNIRKVTDLLDPGAADYYVIGAYGLPDGGFGVLPMEKVDAGMKILVLPQKTSALKSFGFNVQDSLPRVLRIRDTTGPAWKTLDDDYVREWNGEPRTDQKNVFSNQHFGPLAPHAKGAPRWTYNMAVAAVIPRTPDTVGWIPQVEGDFDMNYAGVLQYYKGKGSVTFCTLNFIGRMHTGVKEEDTPKPCSDAACDGAATAVLKDFLLVKPGDHGRRVVASGRHAERILDETGAKKAATKAIGPDVVLVIGSDSPAKPESVLKALEAGANVLVIANDKLASQCGLVYDPARDEGTYLVKFDHANPDLRGIGQAQLRWRDRFRYRPVKSGKDGWKIDAEGLFASKTFKNGAKMFVTDYDPFRLEDTINSEATYLVDNNPVVVDDAARQRNRVRCDISFQRSRQFTARLLTNLGAAPAEDGGVLYRGLVKDFDPYFYTYW